MLDIKSETLLKVAEMKSFTGAAEALSLTQPAVSHHIAKLESELGARLFMRGKNELKPTNEGEIVLSYARRMKALEEKMFLSLKDAPKRLSRVRIGITHTAEASTIAEVLANYGRENRGVTITVITDTIKNLYTMLENYELDLAIVEGKPQGSELRSLMLDTDYLLSVISPDNPLAERAMVTLSDLKRQRMILRLPTSATRMLFESALAGIGESIEAFDVTLEVDNIATIKDLVRKDLGISILPRSACADEIGKGKLVALPIENLSMLRETNIVYHKEFMAIDVIDDIMKTYERSKRHEKKS